MTWKQVAHTVVGGPGVFDPDSDRPQARPERARLEPPGVMSELREALPPTVALDNDANLAAVGERSYGSGRDARTFVYVSVGTGIGMGVIIDGELYRGAHGAAGEVGYLPLGEDGVGGTAGREARRRGILEEAASADAVVRTAKRLGMEGATSAKRVFAAARGGDELALAAVMPKRSVWRSWSAPWPRSSIPSSCCSAAESAAISTSFGRRSSGAWGS